MLLFKCNLKHQWAIPFILYRATLLRYCTIIYKSFIIGMKPGKQQGIKVVEEHKELDNIALGLLELHCILELVVGSQQDRCP